MGNYYNHISKCPMAVFEDCLVDGHFQSLITEGEVEDYVLQAAWIDIQEQYSVAIGDAEQVMYIKMLKELNELVAKYSILTTVLDLMPHYTCREFEQQVNKILGIQIPWTHAAQDKFLEQLASARKRVSGYEMKIDLKKIALQQFEAKIKAKAGTGKASHESFAAVYNLIEEVLDCSVDPQTLTVQRYCERIKRLSQKYKKGGKNNVR